MSNSPMTNRISASASTELYIYTLGPPKAEWQGHVLALPRRQTRALLYRLATSLQLVPRESLCCLFWPEVEEATARSNLSRLVYNLRDKLPIPDLLIMSDDQIGLDVERTWSDTRAFERLWTNWKSHGEILCLQQAVDLYRGPFLAGFSLSRSSEFDTWITLEHESWERAYLQALVILVDAQAASGEYDKAIDYAQRYLASDDLAEAIHRRLIELYAAVEDRAAALRQYERCVTILERELGVGPVPETKAAFQAVLQGQLPRGVTLVTKPPQLPLPGIDVPLVGRESAMHELEHAYSKARKGHGGMVLISGEAGIGKSCLMQDFAIRVQHQSWVLMGAGHQETQTAPYQPIIEALRPKLNMGPVRFNACPPWLAEVSQLLPELRSLHPGLPQPLPGESNWARARLFESLEKLLFGLAGRVRPVLLCLDDLHWADPETLGWIGYLGHHLSFCPLLIIGAYRSEESDRIAELRHSLSHSGVLFDLKLDGLDKAAILLLLQHLGSWGVNREALASRLRQSTGGNPFFLLETLRVIVESGQHLKCHIGLEDVPLPDTVRQAVQTRVERLDPGARQVLEAAAVLGQTFECKAVCLTSGRQEMETINGLDELVVHELLIEQAGRYQFRHEIVRDAVYDGIGYHRRRLLHRRAGKALERLHPDEVTALARHFEHAEQPGRAAYYALQAGLAAKTVFAHSEARTCLDRALALLEQEAGSLREPAAIAANRRLRIQTLRERGWVLRLLGDMEAYGHDLEEESRLATLLGDPGTLAHLRWRQACCHTWFCRCSEARVVAEDGVYLSKLAADRLVEAICWRQVGLAARALGDYSQARAALERALALFEELDEAAYQVHTLGNLSTLWWYLGNYEQAMTLARRALDYCEAKQMALERRVPLGDMGAAASVIGDTHLARRCLEESLSIARNISDRTQEIYCLGHLGWLCIREKKVGEALDRLRDALAVAEQIGSCAEQSGLCAGLAEALQLGGDLDQAITYGRRAMAMAQATCRAYDQQLARRVWEALYRPGV